MFIFFVDKGNNKMNVVQYTKEFYRLNKPIVLTVGFTLLVIVGIIALVYATRPELYDDNLIFKDEHIKNGFVEITVKDAKRYSNGKSGSYYYIFTDKGRLKINSKETVFDVSLYKRIKKECLYRPVQASVSIDSWQTDWRLNEINCK